MTILPEQSNEKEQMLKYAHSLREDIALANQLLNSKGWQFRNKKVKRWIREYKNKLVNDELDMLEISRIRGMVRAWEMEEEELIAVSNRMGEVKEILEKCNQ